ncbi:hypothetical protein EXM30_16935 [Clostridium botulinum]|nr:hypothetical protein [Clostridium botulinum]NFA01588.1 hypothetical protein [Clostridium botulinum]NFA33341.1 hypothetical protein [Clostridium botulinum]NFA87289.1 hypothetical protein [Clostridium botulinum]NFA92639.1 hypothetical protein [Clostridium botulinum]
MGKFDDFDLDVNVNKGKEKQSRIYSCTPGTCARTCDEACAPNYTFVTNCCASFNICFFQ